MINNTTSNQNPEQGFARAAKQPSGTLRRADEQPGGMSGRARIISFDLARGFTVLIMPMIHTVMLCSTPQVQQSLLGDILGFIAEGPGAQLFMLLMGVNFALKQSHSPLGAGVALKRSLFLFLAAYLLNFFKFILPLGLGLMPENLLTELGLTNDFHAAQFFFLIGDILQFAAIANLIIFFVCKSKHYALIALVLAIIIIFISPYLWDWKTGYTGIDTILMLFNGHPPQSFFPVLPWLVYPLLGLTFGYLLKTNNHDFIIKKAGLSGIGLVVISLVLPATSVTVEWLPFYRTEPADTIFHLGFVLVWLAIFHWLSKKIKPNPVFKLFTFCSKYITSIYLIQWVLICWCMAFTGYMQLGFMQTLSWMGALTLITLLLTYKLSHASRKSI